MSAVLNSENNVDLVDSLTIADHTSYLKSKNSLFSDKTERIPGLQSFSDKEESDKSEKSSRCFSLLESKKNNETTKPPKPKVVPFLQLFKYSDWNEKLLLVVSIIIGITGSLATPIAFVIFGRVVDDLTSSFTKVLDKVNENAKWLAIISLAQFVMRFISTFCIQLSAKRQATKIRKLYFAAALRQDESWFQINKTGSLISKISDSVDKLEEGIGEKLLSFISQLSTFVAGLIISLSLGWELALIGFIGIPFMTGAFVSVGIAVAKFSAKELESYSDGASVSSEVFQNIKTVKAFGGESDSEQRFLKHLKSAEKVYVMKETVLGLTFGLIGFTLFSFVALTFWVGTQFIEQGTNLPVGRATIYSASNVSSIIIIVLIGAINLGFALPLIKSFFEAQASAYEVFQTIDRVPEIDKNASGKIIENFRGKIEFRNVTFRYPTRTDFVVLENFSLIVNPGETVAFVGHSGSGKSTAIQLILRFFDPEKGQVLIDDIDIKEFDLKWLRRQMGVVIQEPVLFSETIANNIKMGRENATLVEIKDVSRMANIQAFIERLPEKYETLIGEGGGNLSGGQKQRVAIARALIRNPRVLLLDEATSALDTQSEKVVQNALNKATSGRTVIMVAHRLTTVENANRIIVMEKGGILEQGTHQELVQMKSAYWNMLNRSKSDVIEDFESRDYFSENNINLTTTNSPIQFSRNSLSSSARSISYQVNQGFEEDNPTSSINQPKINRKSSIYERSDVPTDHELSNFEILSLSYPDNLNQTEPDVAIIGLTEGMETITKAKKLRTFLRLMRMNKPERFFLLFGCISSAFSAAVQPAFAMIYSNTFQVYNQLFLNRGENNNRNLISGLMFLVSWVRLFSNIAQGYFFAKAGAKLTTRIRINLFNSIIHQDMSWFDLPENKPGILTACLSAEVPKIQHVSGTSLGLLIESFILIILTLALGFAYSWQLVLLTFGFLPIMLIGAKIQQTRLGGGKIIETVVKGSAIVQETISNHVTVTSYCLEKHFQNNYEETLTNILNYRSFFSFSLTDALINSIPTCLLAAHYSVGALLYENKSISLISIFIVQSVIQFGVRGLGRAAALGPEIAKGKAAAKRVLKIIDTKPKIALNEGIVPKEPLKGNVTFYNVDFAYPTRPEHLILSKFNHEISNGQACALVGESGCGKSTCIQLLQRLYDSFIPSEPPINGDREAGIYLDGYLMSQLQPKWIRRNMGIVSQEPNLFDISIRNNIAYGMNWYAEENNGEQVPMDLIIDAAVQANAHDFIMKLPEGYETLVGERGSKLSGGQKQRIAIARAILRNPPLLLLDEATSALDNENERIVQQALDSATLSGNRTSINVAHRLTTIENCDQIVVLAGGSKIESGTLSELLIKGGAFYKLHSHNIDSNM